MIRSIIIDDEADAREALKLTIEKYCPGVEILSSCSSPEEGLKTIQNYQPDLVFLDVQMPNQSGFDLLEQIADMNFAVIFVTAYNHYAIKAIKFSALDYLLKPVDPDDLVSAVQRVEKWQNMSNQTYRYKSLLRNIQHESRNIERLAIPTHDGMVFFETANIICCRADGNYTALYLTGNNHMLVSKPLTDFDQMLSDSGFFRIHHSALINMKHIQKYVKGDGGYVVLSENHHVDVSRRKKEAFLQQLNKI